MLAPLFLWPTFGFALLPQLPFSHQNRDGRAQPRHVDGTLPYVVRLYACLALNVRPYVLSFVYS